MSREELEMKIRNVQSADEILELFKAAGQEISVEDAAGLYEKVKGQNEGVKELSLDELDEVAGGRDWIEEGCAATVEPGSDCWHTDGGCKLFNIAYENAPYTEDRCPTCGGRVYYVGQFGISNGTLWGAGMDYVNRFICRKCGKYDIKL